MEEIEKNPTAGTDHVRACRTCRHSSELYRGFGDDRVCAMSHARMTPESCCEHHETYEECAKRLALSWLRALILASEERCPGSHISLSPRLFFELSVLWLPSFLQAAGFEDEKLIRTLGFELMRGDEVRTLIPDDTPHAVASRVLDLISSWWEKPPAYPDAENERPESDEVDTVWPF